MSLKILISENSEKLIESMREIFSQRFDEVKFVPKNESEIISEIVNWKPDAAILDLFSLKVDAMNVISRVKRIDPENSTLFTVFAEIGNSNIEHELAKKGVTYFVIRPFNYAEISEKIYQALNNRSTPAAPKTQYLKFAEHPNVANDKHTKNSFEMEVKISDILHQIGIPAHIKGYRYIRMAVMMAIQNPSAIHAITKTLYPDVARQFETTPSRVERAIRHAIEVAWNRGDIDTLNSYFSYTIHNSRGKPTNSEFIALISDTLRIQELSASA